MLILNRVCNLSGVAACKLVHVPARENFRLLCRQLFLQEQTFSCWYAHLTMTTACRVLLQHASWLCMDERQVITSIELVHIVVRSLVQSSAASIEASSILFAALGDPVVP